MTCSSNSLRYRDPKVALFRRWVSYKSRVESYSVFDVVIFKLAPSCGGGAAVNTLNSIEGQYRIELKGG